MFQISKRTLRQLGLATLAGLALEAGSLVAQEPAAIHTKNAALRLPIEMDPRTRSNVAEIKLYVMGPGGRWDCVHTAPANQTAFDFKAPMDGEYKFTFVTVDRRGVATPASVEASSPHRVVVVDTTLPEISVQPSSVRGEPTLQCQVRDANPDWSSVRAVYQAADFTWKPLHMAAADTPTMFRIPSNDVLKSKIRVTAADRAGNRNTKEVDLGSAQAGEKPAVPTTIDKGRPDPALMPKDADPYTAPIPPDVRGANYTELPRAPKADQPPLPILPDIAPIKAPDLPPEIKLPEVPGGRVPELPDLKIPGEAGMKLPETPAVVAPLPGANDMKLPDVPRVGSNGTPGVSPPMDLPPPPVMPVGQTTSTLKPTDPSVPELPDSLKKPEEKLGTRPVINTRTVSINYQLEGSARFAKKTDFWATADGGRSWKQLTDLSAGISPAKLVLPADGVFGIRIRPGAGAKPPEPGEEPDCVVEVDATSPTVSLQPPTIGSDEGTMILNWTASDTNLLGNSINLFYASQEEGPWNVIVRGYKNEGIYRWTLPAGLSGPVYLRVEAMDRAGNVGRMELPTPVSIESSKQRVKVIGVGPGR